MASVDLERSGGCAALIYRYVGMGNEGKQAVGEPKLSRSDPKSCGVAAVPIEEDQTLNAGSG